MGSLELTFVEQKTKLMGMESFGTDWCFRERERERDVSVVSVKAMTGSGEWRRAKTQKRKVVLGKR